jgi:hypothetical protein
MFGASSRDGSGGDARAGPRSIGWGEDAGSGLFRKDSDGGLQPGDVPRERHRGPPGTPVSTGFHASAQHGALPFVCRNLQGALRVV